MKNRLLLQIFLYDGRYHGAGDWPPAPARVFQALVAGAGLSGPLSDQDRVLFEWLESLPAPTIGFPYSRRGQRVNYFVPNNDLDSVGGDPARLPELRVQKLFAPRIFDPEVPFFYLWVFDAVPDRSLKAEEVIRLLERLYQFGRGVDMAWARPELLDEKESKVRLAEYRGQIMRPGDGQKELQCPRHGSLHSLAIRHAAALQKFVEPGAFRQPPKAYFASVRYGGPPQRFLYDLRQSDHNPQRFTAPLVEASLWITQIRDNVMQRLQAALPKQAEAMQRALIGQKPAGQNEDSLPERIRIMPLPSIGHEHVDHGIRRIYVEIPGACGLNAADVHWAFSGLELINLETGELIGVSLHLASEDIMLRHYGIGDNKERKHQTWRTETAAALPETAQRRRIPPERRTQEAKEGRERLSEHGRAATAALQALRHANVLTPVESIVVQREPFSAKGARAELFATGTRFSKHRMWHVEVRFTKPVEGPIAIGDGRFLGLGVMAPVRT